MPEVITVYFGFIYKHTYKAVVFFPAGLRNSASYQSSNEMRDTSPAIDPISDQSLYMYDRSPPVIDPVGVRSMYACTVIKSKNFFSSSFFF